MNTPNRCDIDDNECDGLIVGVVDGPTLCNVHYRRHFATGFPQAMPNTHSRTTKARR